MFFILPNSPYGQKFAIQSSSELVTPPVSLFHSQPIKSQNFRKHINTKTSLIYLRILNDGCLLSRKQEMALSAIPFPIRCTNVDTYKW